MYVSSQDRVRSSCLSKSKNYTPFAFFCSLRVGAGGPFFGIRRGETDILFFWDREVVNQKFAICVANHLDVKVLITKLSRLKQKLLLSIIAMLLINTEEQLIKYVI